MFELKTLPSDETIPSTARLWGQDGTDAAQPSAYPIAKVMEYVTGFAGIAKVITSSGNVTMNAPTIERVITLVMTGSGTATLPSPVENVIINVKAAPGVTGVLASGHIDNTPNATPSITPGSSMQVHSDGITWWVI